MSTELELRPSCHVCGAFFEIRTGTMTPEQRFCGTWYDHPPTRCGSLGGSVLYPSVELLEQHRSMTAAVMF